ncbi:PRTase-like protein [Pyrenochaeta sp. DS3sAY3a]|nr:PRTase-like protein [Pyrenochaeta sp. DS3sAY3a]
MANTQILSDEKYSTLLSQLRDRTITPRKVRALVAELTTILAREAITPPAQDEQIAIIVILRSGMAMMDSFLYEVPEDAKTIVYHLGLFRDKKSLQPVEYYNKLAPKSPKISHGYILDPLLATGGTAEAAVTIAKDWGLDKITFVSIIASRDGLQKAASVWPEGTNFVVGAVDEELDEHGYVKPGLGDIGDRLYGTQLL